MFKSYRVDKNLRPAAVAAHAAAALTNRYKNIKSPPVYRGDLINLWKNCYLLMLKAVAGAVGHNSK